MVVLVLGWLLLACCFCSGCGDAGGDRCVFVCLPEILLSSTTIQQPDRVLKVKPSKSESIAIDCVVKSDAAVMTFVAVA